MAGDVSATHLIEVLKVHRNSLADELAITAAQAKGYIAENEILRAEAQAKNSEIDDLRQELERLRVVPGESE